jgi:hypothetical protein
MPVPYVVAYGIGMKHFLQLVQTEALLIKKSLATFHSLRSFPTIRSSLILRFGTYLAQGSLPVGLGKYILAIRYLCVF